MARLSPSRHTLHCRLRFLDRRAGRPCPLRTTFCCTALAICHSQRLPTQRRRRSDPNATSQTRSRPCDDASSSLSPRPSRDALVATPRSARHYEFPITDAVRLRPFINYPAKLNRFGELHGGYVAATAGLREVVNTVRINGGLSGEAVAAHQRATQMLTTLERNDEPNPNRKLIEGLQVEVNR